MKYSLSSVAFSLCVLSTTVACEEQDLSSLTLSELQGYYTETYQQITELSEDKSCDSVAQCRSLPVGEKSCGGPAAYLIYSTLIEAESIEQLKQLAERSSAISKAYNAKSDLLSNCLYEQPKLAACIDNQCVETDQIGLTE